MRAFIYIAIITIPFLLSACSGSNQPKTTSEEIGPVPLLPAQILVVENALREMIGGPLSSALRGTRAMRFAGKPGLHVCGSITENDKELPFYIELGEEDSKYVAKRGQIGTDPGKKAKVVFMCRQH